MQPQQTINALDVTISGEIKSTGTAYYNPEQDGDFYTFLKDVSAHEKILGFVWDQEKFGVILG